MPLWIGFCISAALLSVAHVFLNRRNRNQGINIPRSPLVDLNNSATFQPQFRNGRGPDQQRKFLIDDILNRGKDRSIVR